MGVPLKLVYEMLAEIHRTPRPDRKIYEELLDYADPVPVNKKIVEEIEKNSILLGVADLSLGDIMEGDKKEIIEKVYFYLNCRESILYIVFVKGISTLGETTKISYYVEDVFLP